MSASTTAGAGLSLTKGQKVDLTKGTTLAILCLGLGWDVNSTTSNPFDLDAFAIPLTGGKLANIADVLYFGSPKANNCPTVLGGALIHSGDNLTGVGDGDDETITMNLGQLPPEIEEVFVCANIFEAEKRRQSFGQVQNGFCRLYNRETGEELMRYDLSEDYSNFNAMVFGRVYRHNGEWKFQALGEGKNGNINDLAAAYL